MTQKTDTKQVKISKVEITNDKITGRGGLFFILRYIENARFYLLFHSYFHFLKRSSKGLSSNQFIKQLLAYFIDGTDLSISSFDRRKQDEAYAAILENTPKQMASSHQVKRFLRKFIVIPNFLYRKLLLAMFLWRLNVEKPEIIILFADSMVLNNNDAKKRQGVEPTYKGKKGFQPMQISWGPYLVDALFRSGKTHCNHGSDLMKAVGRLTNAIRNHYQDVPIILLCDSGFMDDKNFRFFEEKLGIHYICAGKQYQDLKNYVNELSPEQFQQFQNRHQFWHYTEFGNRLKSWTRFRRCIFTTLESDNNGQMLFDFVRTDVFIYTNLGQDDPLTNKLIQAGGQSYLKAENIIVLNHSRGKSELNHRSLKEFATKEQLPFEQFGMNRAYYYFLLMSHFLFEAYKYDISSDVIPVVSYPNTFRRQLIDFAAKIVTTGGEYILKVSNYIFTHLKIQRIWENCRKTQPIVCLE